MKNARKLTSILVLIAMLFMIAAPAMAEDVTPDQDIAPVPTNYKITINNDIAGHTYEAYQIFAGDLSTKIVGEGADATDKYVLSNIVWGSGVTDEGKSHFGDAAAKAEGLTEANVAAFATEVEGYLASYSGSASEVKNGVYTISGLAAGYYLIKDSDKSLNGKDDAYTAFILKVVGDASATPKSGKPSSEKKVKDIDDSTGTAYTDWQDSADYDIGDMVPFQLKATIAQDYASYETYKLTFHDKEETGLTFKKDTVEVFVDGTKITSGYEVVTEGLQDGDTFEVQFADLKNIASVKAGSVITVEYKSELNTNANIGATGNKNTMHITYSNNPNDEQGGENGKTPDDTVIVFTFQTIVNKVDETGEALTGADFTLEKLVNGTWTGVTVVKASSGTKFTMTGLDDGRYRLTESKTPVGYNTIAPVHFVIEASHDADKTTLGDLKAYITNEEGTKKIDEAGAEINLGTISLPEGSITTNIENKKGTELPETGGIGTTIFYVVGAALVVGAGVLLVTKKRMTGQR